MDYNEHRAYHREHPDEGNFVGEPDTATSQGRSDATNGALTSEEDTLIEMNALVWNGLCRLPGILLMDRDDARQHIDGINNIILARAGARANPGMVRQQ